MLHLIRGKTINRSRARADTILNPHAASQGAGEAVDKLATRYDEWPQVGQEVLLSAIVEALDKLLVQP
jgi:hypothetical protein